MKSSTKERTLEGSFSSLRATPVRANAPLNRVTRWPLLGLAAMASLALSCSPSDPGSSASGTGGKAASTGGSTGSGGSDTTSSGGASNPGSGGTSATGSGGDTSGSGSGGTTATGSGGKATTGGGGNNSGGAGGTATTPGTGGTSGPTQSCADPTAKGSTDIPNVGTAPGAITQAELAGASPATKYFASIPGNLPPAGTTDPAKQVGLFIVFHEHGSSPDVEMPSVIKSLANLKRSGDFIVLGLPIDPAAVAAGSHPYTKDDHTRAKLLLDYALKTWPINPRRVYVWGRGEGATMSHSWGTENKTAIAAMITYSWGWDTRNWPSNAANDEPDLYLVIGLADYPDSHVPLVRRVYGYAKTAGFKILYREVPGLKGPTAGAVTNDDAVAWAINSRHKTVALSATETAALAPYQDAGAAAGICPDGALFAKLEVVGGPAAGKVMPGVLRAGTEASRLLATQLAGRANFGDVADTELGLKLKDTAATIRKAAITSLGVNANWRTAPAQKALIDFVGNTTADATERGLAIDAIGAAVKFQIGGDVATGGYQDPPLFQALITALSDADQTIRTKAFAILKPAMTTSNYNPATAPASQAAAIQAWTDWLKTLK